eukprot:scaffold49917_cov34-Attheya_sp.AAC.2
MPRKGHLDQVLHIFAYLKKYKSSKCVFDVSNPSFGDRFKPVEWDKFYPDAKEDVPHNMPAPSGNEKQNTVEASTFGSEFVAMKTAAEQIMALRNKLRIFGIPIDGPANVFYDNEAVLVMNSSIPTSTIKKKHLLICYHLVRSYCAAGGMRADDDDVRQCLDRRLARNGLRPEPRRSWLPGIGNSGFRWYGIPDSDKYFL